MREKHFMLDIESTDTDFKNSDILQIGILEADFKDGFWHPGRSFNKFLNTDKRPATQFAKENMYELFETCREVPYETPEEVRAEVLSFFKACGAHSPYVYLMGWNVTMFDIPFMFEKDYLRTFYRQTIDGKDISKGDIHYRVYEQSGSISNAMCALGVDGRNDLVQMAFDAYPEILLPAGKEHDALFDCYRQLRVENGIIRLQRRGTASFSIV